MIGLTKQFKKRCLVSLAVLAISLPAVAISAVAPTISIQPTIRYPEGAPVRNTAISPVDGSIYVVSVGGGVARFDKYGNLIKNFGKIAGDDPVTGVAVAQDGTLVAAAKRQVIRFSADGVKISNMLSDAPFGSTCSVAIDDLGYIYVLDTITSKVSIFSSDYQFVKSFGSFGFADGQMVNPANLTFDNVNRQIIVADTINQRVQFFDTNGNFIKKFGLVQTLMGRPIDPMEFYYVSSVALEYTKQEPKQLNRLYASDRANMLKVFDPAGAVSPLLFADTANNVIGIPSGFGDGMYSIPEHVTFDNTNNRLLLSNSNGVTVFGVDGGGTPADTTPPTFTVNPLQTTTSIPTLILQGTVEEGSTINVSSTAAVGAISYSGASWSATVSTLVPGLNSFAISAKDKAGNIASAQTLSTTYLLPAPSLVVTSAATLTNNASYLLTGTTDAGAAVTVKNLGTNVEAQAALNGTSWSYQAALAEGNNNFAVSASLPNSQSATASAAVILDTQAPLLSVSALTNGSITSTQVQNISGTVADTAQTSLLVNNNPVDIINGAFSTALNLVAGDNTVVVIAADAAGNVSQDSRTIKYDGTAPVITLADTTIPDNAVTTAPIFDLKGSVSEAAKVTVAGNEVALDSANSFATTVALNAGANTVEIVASDLAGNSSSVKRTVTYNPQTVDLSILVPSQDFATSRAQVAFVGKATKGSAVTYCVNGASQQKAKTVNGNYIFAVEFDKNGTYSVAVTATDKSGASTTVVRNIIYKALKNDKSRNGHNKDRD